ncbi:hypothetical protein DI43_10580 [Geobacillus sp. CAMR12739]|nr:hypothetical protein DI43_10580 [Geobacillus sp. CAMR12739]
MKDSDIEAILDRADEISDKLDKYKDEETKIDEQLAVLSDQVRRLERERRQLIAQSSATKQELSRWIGEYEEKVNQYRAFLKKFKEKELYQLVLLPAIRQLKQNIRKEREYLDAKYKEKMQFAPYEQFIEKLLEVSVFPPLLKNQKTN